MTATTVFDALAARDPRFAHVEDLRLGFGTFPLSREGRPRNEDAVALIRFALDQGIRLLDTADSYHLAGESPGHGENLIREALASWNGDRDSVIVATKGGRVYAPDGQRYHRASPTQIISACEASLRRLAVDTIDLYFLHRPDPAYTYSDQIDALAKLVASGKIRHAGVSNANPEQIEIASGILGGALVAVQNEFSPWFRTSEPEVVLTEQLGLLFLPWSPLGGADKTRFLLSVPQIVALGEKYGRSVYEVVLAWVLAQGPHMVPIPGASRASSLRSSLSILDFELAPEDLAALNSLNPAPPSPQTPA